MRVAAERIKSFRRSEKLSSIWTDVILILKHIHKNICTHSKSIMIRKSLFNVIYKIFVCLHKHMYVLNGIKFNFTRLINFCLTYFFLSLLTLYLIVYDFPLILSFVTFPINFWLWWGWRMMFECWKIKWIKVINFFFSFPKDLIQAWSSHCFYYSFWRELWHTKFYTMKIFFLYT